MKKNIIALLVLINASLFGQSFFPFWDDTTNTSWEGSLKGDLYYTDLNGTTQYWSNTTPVGLDLNGAEMVTKDSNSTFESGDTTDWTGNGTHSIDTSGTYKYAGSYAGKVISTGVGDTTTNFISLAYTQFQPIVAGKKYTVEYWANAVGKEGTALYTSNLSTTDSWSVGGGTISGNNTISDGATSMDSVLAFAGNSSAVASLSRVINQNTTNGYIINFWYLIPASNDTIVKAFYTNNTSDGLVFTGYSRYIAVQGTWTNAIIKLKFTSGGLKINLANTGGTNVSTMDSFYIANMTITPIVQPTYTLKIGSKSVTSDTISVIPGVFEKVVYNFLATTAEVNTPIKIYCSQADTGWIDNFSITQAKDLMVNVWAKTSSSGTNKAIVSHQTGTAATSYGFLFNIGTTDKISALLYDGIAINAANSTATITDGTYRLLTLIYDRIDDIKIGINGVMTDSLDLNLGKIDNTNDLTIGRVSSSAVRYFLGQIGETQIVSFDDISTLDKTPLQIYQRGRNRVHMYDSYVGGTIQAWFFNTATANDASGNGNNLTGSGSPSVSTLTTGY